MAQEKTPGVYIEEIPAFPNSVVEVATGIPAILGYTEKAIDGTTSIAGVPKRITSMSEFEAHFGGPPNRKFTRTKADDGNITFAVNGQNFFLYHSLRLYFDNGGGPCWIVSIGQYDADTHAAGDVTDAIWDDLAKVQEPAMYVMPDAVTLPEADYGKLTEEMMMQCGDRLKNRVALVDIYNGSSSDIETVIDNGFRNLSFPDEPSYAAAYYPWLNTNIVDASTVDFTNLDDDSRSALADDMGNEVPALSGQAKLLAESIKNPPANDKEKLKTHSALMIFSSTYRQAMAGLLDAINVLPAAAAMAGICARTDRSRGVWKAPANTGVMSVLSPTVAVSDAQQEGLNVPLHGHAVNAIRAFPGRGVLVWGARTLDGNSQDNRYINVRRTLIMLEQSIFAAAQAYVFEPNVAGTWMAVKTMIENFLNNQWVAGALAGSTPKEAYDVSVGLGTTMTGNDILDGYMRVTVHVALSHPAEFIVITFQQKMQTS